MHCWIFTIPVLVHCKLTGFKNIHNSPNGSDRNRRDINLLRLLFNPLSLLILTAQFISEPNGQVLYEILFTSFV